MRWIDQRAYEVCRMSYIYKRGSNSLKVASSSSIENYRYKELVKKSYTYNISFGQVQNMNSNYTDNLPLNPTIFMDSGRANMDSIDSNDIHFYQAPNQAIFPSDTGFLDYDNVSADGNEPLNTAYGDVGNSENGVNYSTMNYNSNNYNSSFVSYPIHQTLVQTPSTSSGFPTDYDLNSYGGPSIHRPLSQTSEQTSTFSNNASMVTSATSHGQVIIIVNADIDLEKLLFTIQLCRRVERIYM